MKEMNIQFHKTRPQNPFDDGAKARLHRMGLLRIDGSVDEATLDALSRAYSGLLEALDVMLELTKAQPGFYSKDGLHEPFLLRFTGNGKGAGYLFSVAWLDAATHIATVPRMKGERIIWISESGSFGEIDLPRHHFFAARQKDGTHRFFGSNEPEKI